MYFGLVLLVDLIAMVVAWQEEFVIHLDYYFLVHCVDIALVVEPVVAAH